MADRAIQPSGAVAPPAIALKKETTMSTTTRIPRGRQFFANPGPTNIPDSILKAVAHVSVDFNDPAFLKVYDAAVAGVKRVLRTQHDVFLYTGSGHAAWEAALVNLFSPGDALLVIETGYFSEAGAKMAQDFALEIRTLEADWRRGADFAALRAPASVIVEEAHPDFSEAHDTFQTLRALGFAVARKNLLETHRDKLKPEVIWNIEKGLKLTADDIIRAEIQRATLIKRAFAFFETYDLLLCPATIVPAFPVEQRYLESCNGVVFDNYVGWLAIVYAITLVGSPSISIPAGFTTSGLPVGLQVVARPRAEARMFAGAKLLEDILGLKGSVPIDPRPGT